MIDFDMVEINDIVTISGDTKCMVYHKDRERLYISNASGFKTEITRDCMSIIEAHNYVGAGLELIINEMRLI